MVVALRIHGLPLPGHLPNQEDKVLLLPSRAFN